MIGEDGDPRSWKVEHEGQGPESLQDLGFSPLQSTVVFRRIFDPKVTTYDWMKEIPDLIL